MTARTTSETPVKRLLSFIAAGAIAVTGLVASPAAAAEPPPPAELAVEGVLQVVADESGAGGNIVTVLTETGAAIEVTGDAIDGAVSGDKFEGVIALDGEVAEAVADAPTDTAAVEAVAETQDEPVEVVEADIEPAVAAAVAAKQHYVDVLYAAPAGHWTPSVADVDQMVNRIDDFWSSQSAGQVSGISRVSEVKYATISNTTQLCTAQQMWTYAAGPSGFNRPGTNPQTYYYGGTTQTHLLVIVPGDICPNGSGLGTVGSVHAGGVTWSSVPNDQTQWDQVVFHEVGHNLGLGHSNLTSCTLPKVEGSGCTQREYYDFYDVMGGGFIAGSVNNFHDLAALNVSQKVNLGALEEGTGVTTVTKDGGVEQEFTIRANGTDSGMRGLIVVHPTTGERTFVEYRYATGRDANAFYKRYSSPDYGNGVRFHRHECATSSCAGAASTLLRNSAGKLFYSAGESYTAPYTTGNPPFKVEVLSAGGTTANVKVSFDVPDPLVAGTPTITGTSQVGVKLTATPGTWPLNTKFTYQWLADGDVIAGATASSFTPKGEHAGKTISVKVTGTLNGQSETAESDPTAPVATGLLAHGIPTISGTVKVGSTLTAVTSKWTTSGTVFAYQWLLDGVEVPGATGKTFTLRGEDEGKRASVRVTGSLTGYTTETETSAQTATVGLGTLTGPVPTITGTPKVDEVLTVAPGTWPAGVTLTYQWAAAGVNIPGATGATFAPTVEHVGKTITVKVTGTLAGYAPLTKTSSATGKVVGDMTAPAPTIAGVAQVGGTLTADPGVWPKGTKFAYQWTVDGEDVKFATSKTFKVTAAHVGTVISVRVTGSYDGFVITSDAAVETPAVAPAVLKTDEPWIAGTPAVGNKLIAYGGTWTFGTTFTYQWHANGAEIPGATDLTLLLTKEYADAAITVAVTGTLDGYLPVTVVSPAAVDVELGTFSPSTPKITGTLKVGNTLKANPVTVDNITHEFQWFADGDPIAGATESTYTLTEDEKGKQLTVQVTYNKDGYHPATKTSAKTTAIR